MHRIFVLAIAMLFILLVSSLAANWSTPEWGQAKWSTSDWGLNNWNNGGPGSPGEPAHGYIMFTDGAGINFKDTGGITFKDI